MSAKSAILALADGTLLEGVSIGACGTSVGELVFNTAMTGYQEILTDPSYTKQIVMLTNSHIGNTGCNQEDMESQRVWASGLVVRNCSFAASSYRSKWSLPVWLEKQGVVAIAGIDTRALTLRLREKGEIAACISTEVQNPERAITIAKTFKGLEGLDLACEVSRHTQEPWHQGQGAWASVSHPPLYHIVVYDFGVKSTILRILYDKGCQVSLVPAKTSATEVLRLNPDGVVLSNGPGDPKACHYAIAAAKTFLEKGVPLLGICLGFQIMALALGAKSVKMKFGHHGANHPVASIDEPKQVFITSQNHSFAIDEASLPESLQVTHKSLFDQTLQGFKHKTKPALGFQGHPEAAPGPHDIELLFEQFLVIIKDFLKHKRS